MKKSLQKSANKQATPKTQQASLATQNPLSESVVPKLMQTITALREEVAKLKAELQQIKLATARTEANKIIYRNGIQQ